MKAKDYASRLKRNEQVTFIIAKAVKDTNTPFYHFEYKDTPILTNWELDERNTWINKYIVLNANHPPIDITGHWVRAYEKGHLKCAVITTEEDLHTLYNKAQAEEMISYYDKTVREQLNKMGL